MTAETVAEYDVVLCVGDTTFLDYGRIVAKKEGYGPIGKAGNGLILPSVAKLTREDDSLNQPSNPWGLCEIDIVQFWLCDVFAIENVIRAKYEYQLVLNQMR